MPFESRPSQPGVKKIDQEEVISAVAERRSQLGLDTVTAETDLLNKDIRRIQSNPTTSGTDKPAA